MKLFENTIGSWVLRIVISFFGPIAVNRILVAIEGRTMMNYDGVWSYPETSALILFIFLAVFGIIGPLWRIQAAKNKKINNV